MMFRTTALAIAAAVTLAACGDSTSPLTNDDFAPTLGIDLDAMVKTASGLYYQDIETGTGTEATAGTVATLHYDAFLADGTKFDSSRDRGTEFSFTLGSGSVIPGFDEGVRGTRVGGKRKVVIPPTLAYGENGIPPTIPPNATLVFDFELLSVTP